MLAGEKKCMPTTSCGREMLAAISLMLRYDVLEARIAPGLAILSSFANALADSVGEARDQHRRRIGREGEERLGQRSEPIAGHDPWLAPEAPVGQAAGEELGETSGRLGDSVDRAERGSGQPKHQRDERGKERVIDLARQVHEQADEAEDPDVSGQARARGHGASSRAGAANARRVENSEQQY
jgi:hypothetical protein